MVWDLALTTLGPQIVPFAFSLSPTFVIIASFVYVYLSKYIDNSVLHFRFWFCNQRRLHLCNSCDNETYNNSRTGCFNS